MSQQRMTAAQHRTDKQCCGELYCKYYLYMVLWCFSQNYFSLSVSWCIKCGGQRSGTHGVITSPNYPANYSNNADCWWNITAPLMHAIRMTFIDFSLERRWPGRQCGDFVEVNYGIVYP